MGEPTLPTRKFEEVWATLNLDEATLAVDLDATITPEQAHWESLSGALELPTLGIADEGHGTPELTVTGTLGQGGMGVVHLATQLSLNRDVAVKSLIPGQRHASARHKLLQEAWMTGQLEHPNIVPIHQLGKNVDGDPVLVMKLVEGTSFKDVLHGVCSPVRDHDHNDPLDVYLEILADVCHALEFAHSRGIVHRDLKPDNVMIGSFGEVYLLDWGVAVSTRDDGDGRLPLASMIDHIAGTPAYMAPEMADAGLGPVTPRTDVYLLGAVLHEIITGKAPHGGDSLYAVLYAAHTSAPPRFEDRVPEELAHICRKAMSRDPDQRHRGAGEFRQALNAFMRHRASYEVSEEARRQYADLVLLLSGPETPDRHRAYELFGQCRAGFQQALRIHEQNDSARRGEQRAVERMVDYEIDRGAHEAAQLLIEQMPQPGAVDLQRKAELEQRLAGKREEIDRLRRLGRDLDLNVSARSRVRYVLALGVFWGVLSMTTGILLRLGLMDLTTADLLLPNVLFGGGLAVAAALWRRTLLSNTANRRLVLAFLLIFLGASIQGFTAVLLAQDLADVVVGNEVLMFVVLAMIAVSIDGRLVAVAAVYLTSALSCAVLSDYAFDIAGVADLIGMSLLAAMWRPREEAPEPR